MSDNFTPLRLQPLDGVAHITKPNHHYQTGTLYSSALDVMTDFERVIPVEVSDQMNIDDALTFMKSQHVRLLIALNAKGVFSGVITAADLMGSKPLAYAEQAGVNLDQIEVRDVMTKRDMVQVVTLDQVNLSQVGDI
ncbi:MAG: CBS domain-containing protein, partial [Pontibacterium sp.]